YRNSFNVVVAGSDLKSGSEIAATLTNAGYSCELRINIATLILELLKTPPHIIVLFYNDSYFLTGKNSHKEFIKKLRTFLPDVQIIFLVEQKDMVKACELYELGIYDCIVWPVANQLLILKAVDRAAETDYYILLNGQTRTKDEDLVTVQDSNFAIFNIWLKGIELVASREQLNRLWLQEAVRILRANKAIFMRYNPTKKTLIVAETIGFDDEFEISDIGVDLLEKEPGFGEKMLHSPENLYALREFVEKGLCCESAFYFPHVYKGKVLGVFIIPFVDAKVVSGKQNEFSYLGACLHSLHRQYEHLEMKAYLKKFVVYDIESEVLHSDFVYKKVKEEISRARRIGMPVSLLSLSIDNFEEIALIHSSEAIVKLLKAFAEILVKNSRLNDIVGRSDRGQFIICLPHTDKRGGAIKAERIRRLIESADFSSILGAAENLTISVGVSEYPSICHDVGELINTSEMAMYEVRKKGSNKICLAAAPFSFVPDFVVKNV
ncbi:MAG: hypothetical protein A2Z20_11515, partial [Bdellovibrionales bacterium RBG_16_40_8]